MLELTMLLGVGLAFSCVALRFIWSALEAWK